MSARYHLQVHDKVKTLDALIDALCGEARISLEGDLSQVRWDGFDVIHEEQGSVLKRNTAWPQQDFVILPLEQVTVAHVHKVLHAIGLKRRVLHIMIEKRGEQVFGAYDQFLHGCWVSAVDASVLDSLVEQGALKSYSLAVS